MRAETKAYALLIATMALIVASLAVVIISQPAEAREIEPEWTWRVYPTDRTNTGAYIRMKMDAIEQRVAEIIEQYEAEQAEQQAWEEHQYYESYAYTQSYDAGYSSGIYYAEYSDAYNTDGPSHTMPGWYDGYLETYYNASSHYLAPTWTLDSEGFYHDENGRYVVGVEISHADEMPYGTVVQTGKGEGVVYDYGAGAEVHDFATNW